jgi:hypothetical protein
MAKYSEFQNFGKLTKYSYGPEIAIRRTLAFFVNMYNSCFLPQVKKNILR